MEFGSISRRKNKSSKLSQQQQQDSRDRRSFSTSNLSFTSNCSTTSIGRRSLYLNLPNKDLGLERGSDGRVLHLKKGGLAHSSGVIQVGDFVRLYDSPIVGAGEFSSPGDDDMITVHVTYGALDVETRPPCPLAIKIGNKSSTSLGIALGDTIGKQVKITSIQTGSLADRCGFLMPGDILTSVQISPNETIPCSPYYTSFQIAQILRKLASNKSSVTLTIVPIEEIIESSCSDNNSISVSGSTVTLRDNDRDSPSISGQIMTHKKTTTTTTLPSYGFFSNSKKNTGGNCTTSGSSNSNSKTFHGEKLDFNNGKIQEKDEEEDEEGADCENEEENECVLSLCLWKDRLYEDWGFSLIDDDDNDNEDNEQESSRHEKDKKFHSRRKSRRKKRFGAYVHQIRPGGPAFISGLRSGDRFLQINDRDVTNLESTMLVPILASLDALNLVVVRKNPE